MASIFKRIVDGDIPCYKIAENSEFLAFLDVNPVQPGHTLVIPKEEIDYFFDLEDDLLAKMIVFAKEVANNIRIELNCKKVAVVVIGLEVPHAHIHLIPMNNEGDVDFTKKKSLSTDEFLALQNRIMLK